jgi:hypothetical protein
LNQHQIQLKTIMFKVLQQSCHSRSCLTSSQLLLNATPCLPVGLAGPVSSTTVGCLSNAESRRFARSTKPWKTGPIDLIKKGVITYEYRRLRGKKVAKVELPDFDLIRSQSQSMRSTPEEMRSKLKEKGIVPHRSWDERPLYIATSGSVMDAYKPPEGDGKLSIISKEVRVISHFELRCFSD